MEQLDLLTWEPPRKFIPFPLANRTGKVRRVAEVLRQKRGRDANSYWRAQVRHLVEHLRSIGCRDDEIARQIRTFHDAVQAELRRGYFVDHASNTPQGAA
ncbi:MAG: DUF6074 family protein [Allorhizobium sp.]